MSEAQLDLCAAVECLLFVSREPVPALRLAEVLGAPLEQIPLLIEELGRRLEHTGLHVVPLAGGYCLATREAYAEPVRKFLEPKPQQLSPQALETLAIVAYRQPVTRPQVEQVRGVNSAGPLRSLLDRRLLKVTGRQNAPGRPFLFVTTREFLEVFGLPSLEDLPPLSGDVTQALTQALSVESPVEEPAAKEAEAPFEFEA